MLHGELVDLRARRAEDVAVLQEELHDDVPTRSRADSRAWRPISPDSEASPYAVRDPADDVAFFSVVDRTSQELAGEALLWGIDSHNRRAHLGMALRPNMRRRGMGIDVTRVLCRYAFATLGLHRIQLETLADNEAMVRVAERAGFRREGILRQSAWVTGAFLDEVVYGLVVADWSES